MKARFIEPMLLLRTDMLPSGRDMSFELKWDGYRAVAFKTGGKVHLRSGNNNDFSARYPAIATALAKLPDETVIDGEIVALDETGRPSFNALQNYGSGGAPLLYYIFDVMILKGRDVMAEPMAARRDLLREGVLQRLGEPIRESLELDASLPDLMQAVKAQRFEGLVAKRRGSRYEPGQRSGAWQKMRVNQGQEFVIAGYTPSPKNFDSIIRQVVLVLYWSRKAGLSTQHGYRSALRSMQGSMLVIQTVEDRLRIRFRKYAARGYTANVTLDPPLPVPLTRVAEPREAFIVKISASPGSVYWFTDRRILHETQTKVEEMARYCDIRHAHWMFSDLRQRWERGEAVAEMKQQHFDRIEIETETATVALEGLGQAYSPALAFLQTLTC
jgi:hypothetical protein